MHHARMVHARSHRSSKPSVITGALVGFVSSSMNAGARARLPHVRPTAPRGRSPRPVWHQLSARRNVSSPTGAVSETVMAISRATLSGGVAPKAFQLHAWIQGCGEVLMLVDLGSSTSFINQELAKTIAGTQPLSRPCNKVRVADGGELICTTQVPQCTWRTQGSEFHTDMKILTLSTYDVILGMDWLEAHIPMTIDWRAKFIQFATPGGLFAWP